MGTRWSLAGSPWGGSRVSLRFGVWWLGPAGSRLLARQQVVFKVKVPTPTASQIGSCHSRRAQGWCCSSCMQLSRKIWLHNAAAVPWQWSSGLGEEALWNGNGMERGRAKCHKRCWFPGCVLLASCSCPLCCALSAALLEDRQDWGGAKSLRLEGPRSTRVY